MQPVGEIWVSTSMSDFFCLGFPLLYQEENHFCHWYVLRILLPTRHTMCDGAFALVSLVRSLIFKCRLTHSTFMHKLLKLVHSFFFNINWLIYTQVTIDGVTSIWAILDKTINSSSRFCRGFENASFYTKVFFGLIKIAERCQYYLRLAGLELCWYTLKLSNIIFGLVTDFMIRFLAHFPRWNVANKAALLFR